MIEFTTKYNIQLNEEVFNKYTDMSKYNKEARTLLNNFPIEKANGQQIKINENNYIILIIYSKIIHEYIWIRKGYIQSEHRTS